MRTPPLNVTSHLCFYLFDSSPCMPHADSFFRHPPFKASSDWLSFVSPFPKAENLLTVNFLILASHLTGVRYVVAKFEDELYGIDANCASCKFPVIEGKVRIAWWHRNRHSSLTHPRRHCTQDLTI